MRKEQFRVILRTIPDDINGCFHYAAIFPDMSAKPGRVAFMAFDIDRYGKVVYLYNDEMTVSYFYGCTYYVKPTICKDYWRPGCGLFHSVKEYLESEPDPVDGEIILRYRLPDLAKSAWKWALCKSVA